jgi:hypothetical protein
VKKQANISVSESSLRRTKRRGKNNRRSSEDMSEQLIRRFIKECKKERIVKIYIEKTGYHKTKSQKKREKRNRAIRRLKK